MLHLLRTELLLPLLALPLLPSDVFAFAITIWAPGDLVAFQLLAKMSSAAAARRAMCVRNICEATLALPPTLPLPPSCGTGWPTQRSHATLLTLYTLRPCSLSPLHSRHAFIYTLKMCANNNSVKNCYENAQSGWLWHCADADADADQRSDCAQ